MMHRYMGDTEVVLDEKCPVIGIHKLVSEDPSDLIENEFFNLVDVFQDLVPIATTNTTTGVAVAAVAVASDLTYFAFNADVLQHLFIPGPCTSATAIRAQIRRRVGSQEAEMRSLPRMGIHDQRVAIELDTRDPQFHGNIGERGRRVIEQDLRCQAEAYVAFVAHSCRDLRVERVLRCRVRQRRRGGARVIVLWAWVRSGGLGTRFSTERCRAQVRA